MSLKQPLHSSAHGGWCKRNLMLYVAVRSGTSQSHAFVWCIGGCLSSHEMVEERKACETSATRPTEMPVPKTLSPLTCDQATRQRSAPHTPTDMCLHLLFSSPPRPPFIDR